MYLLPIVTVTSVVLPFVVVASIGAPLFAVWVVVDYWRVARRAASPAPVAAGTSETRQMWASE
ncbi:hypothetical protein ACFFYR_13770 [Paraburkholderia dipogonis]|uniref:hypothetical protein n=1 Tax=Paraburkholderia dipogonis TaxID=1211383 RepID=UPI0035E64D8D